MPICFSAGLHSSSSAPISGRRWRARTLASLLVKLRRSWATSGLNWQPKIKLRTSRRLWSWRRNTRRYFIYLWTYSFSRLVDGVFPDVTFYDVNFRTLLHTAPRELSQMSQRKEDQDGQRARRQMSRMMTTTRMKRMRTKMMMMIWMMTMTSKSIRNFCAVLFAKQCEMHFFCLFGVFFFLNNLTFFFLPKHVQRCV